MNTPMTQPLTTEPLPAEIPEMGTPFTYRNPLIGGVPGSGKSVLLTVLAAHAALTTDPHPTETEKSR